MILERLEVHNFLSISRIVLNLKDQGLVLLKGKNLDNDSLNNNGAGKSSIIESLVYALYGRTIRGIKGDAVVNRVVGKDTKVFLDLTDDDGTKYRIARYRKHSVNKNKSMLYRNGKDITPKSEADFNTFVANLLQADYLTLTSSLIYSAESFKFTSATDAEMKSTFDTMLGLDVYQKCLDITKARLVDVETKVQEYHWKIDSKYADIQQAQNAIQSVNEQKEEQRQKVAQRRAELEQKVSNQAAVVEQKKSELKSTQAQLDTAKSAQEKAEQALTELQELMNAVSKVQEGIQDSKNHIKDAEWKLNRLDRDIKDATDNLNRKNDQIASKRAEIKTMIDKLTHLYDDIGQPCPTCGQPLTEECIAPAEEKLKQQIEGLRSEYQELRDKARNVQGEIDQLNRSVGVAKDELAKYQEQQSGYLSILDKHKDAIDQKEVAELELKKAQRYFQDVSTQMAVCTSELESAQKLLQYHKEALEELDKNDPYASYDNLMKKYQDKIELDNSEVQTLRDSAQEVEDEKTCLEFWKKAYSNQGIKSYILDDITPFLNRRVNKYLSKLASGHIEVKFNTQTTLKSGEVREKFSIDITNHDGGADYTANSGGEKKRIDIAINLALQDLVAARSNKSLNIAVYDEALDDNLDKFGVESVMSLLKEMATEKSSIFVISHNTDIQSEFTNVITVVKKGGLSTLEEPGTEEGEDS